MTAGSLLPRAARWRGVWLNTAARMFTSAPAARHAVTSAGVAVRKNRLVFHPSHPWASP